MRERWELLTLGVFALGVAYGIVNEGLLAHTLLRAEHVPIGNFDHDLVAGGVNLSWAALIVPWHALMAVPLPLTLLDGWFPDAARTRWLARGPFAALTAVVAGAVAFVALVRPPDVQMRGFLLAIAALVLCAWLVRRRRVRCASSQRSASAHHAAQLRAHRSELCGALPPQHTASRCRPRFDVDIRGHVVSSSGVRGGARKTATRA